MESRLSAACRISVESVTLKPKHEAVATPPTTHGGWCGPSASPSAGCRDSICADAGTVQADGQQRGATERQERSQTVRGAHAHVLTRARIDIQCSSRSTAGS